MTDRNQETPREQGRSPEEYRRGGGKVLRMLLDTMTALTPSVRASVGLPASNDRLRDALLDAALDVVAEEPDQRPDVWQAQLAAALQAWLAADADMLAAALAAAVERLDQTRRERAGGDQFIAGKRSMVRWLRTMASDPAATGLDADTMRRILDGARANLDSAAERLAPLAEQAPTRAQAEAESQATIAEAKHRIALDNARAEGRAEVLAWFERHAAGIQSAREGALITEAVAEFWRDRPASAVPLRPVVSVASAAEAIKSLRSSHVMETAAWYQARQVAAVEFERAYDLTYDGQPAAHARPRPATVRHAGLKCRTCSTEIAYDQEAADPDRCAGCQPSRTP